MATGTERRGGRAANLLAFGFAAAGAAILLAPAFARADSMRCGSRLVRQDDSIEEVLETCGEPASRERSWIQRAPRYEVGGREYSFPGREDVPVDLWTYDFGPHKLMQRVRFVAGKVESIETLDRGTNR
jgi:hypothetical protein